MVRQGVDQRRARKRREEAEKNLEEAEIKLEADYISLQDEEKKLVKDLSKKYGQGSLDPKTGVFTPTENTEEK